MAPKVLEIVVYGRAPADPVVLEALPAGMRVSRAIEYSEGGSNRGVTSLGANTAASGRWDRLDLLVRIGVTPDAPPADSVEVRVNGQPLDDDRLQWLADGIVTARDLPADGSSVSVQLETGDELTLDDIARLVLPIRRVVRVALAGDLDRAVRHAIEADPGLEVVAENPSIVIRQGGAATFGDLPTLQFVSAVDQEAAFEIAYTGDDSAELALRSSIAALGLDQIDAAGLAAEARRPVGVQLRHAELPGISVWDELLAHYNFTGSRSFPLFISRAARWLAGEPAWHPYLAAGKPLPSTTVWSLAATPDASLDALGADYILGAAGTVETNGAKAAIALLSDAVTERNAGKPLAMSQAGGGFADTGIVTWLILAALLLLGVEWYLYQRGLMP